MGRMARCAVLLLVACLVLDMATPLLPGAFRLDPSESVEVAAGRYVPPIAVVALAHSLNGGEARRSDDRGFTAHVPATYAAPERRRACHPPCARSAARNDARSTNDDD